MSALLPYLAGGGALLSVGLAIAVAVLAIQRARSVKDAARGWAQQAAAARQCEELAEQLDTVIADKAEERRRHLAEVADLRAELAVCVERYDEMTDEQLLEELKRITTPRSRR